MSKPLHVFVAVAAFVSMTTSAFADPAFDAVVKQLTSEKPKFADRHQKLLDERYDLSNKPAQGVTTSRGKAVQAGGEEDRRRERRQQVVGQVEVEVEAGQVAALLLLDFVDRGLRKEHPACFVVRMRQRIETRGPGILGLDVGR